MKKALLFFSVILFFAVSCNNYEYGGVSFRTKKNRIANEWRIDAAYKNGIEMTNDLPKFSIEFQKDGDAIKTDSLISSLGADSIVYKTGLWEFDDDAENVLLIFGNRFGIVESHIWRILKLTNDEFWFEEADSIDLLEYHMVEAQ
jgi:hypothetical protein